MTQISQVESRTQFSDCYVDLSKNLDLRDLILYTPQQPDAMPLAQETCSQNSVTTPLEALLF